MGNLKRVKMVSFSERVDISESEKFPFASMEMVPNFAYCILRSVKEEVEANGGENVFKTVSNLAFLMLDDIQSKTRYIMKSGKKEATRYLEEFKKDETGREEKRILLLESYGLFLRRARRERRVLAQMLNGIEEFYMENPCEEMEEAIFFGTKVLAHIDIMISLHEEELNFYYSSFVCSDAMQGEKDEDRESILQERSGDLEKELSLRRT